MTVDVSEADLAKALPQCFRRLERRWSALPDTAAPIAAMIGVFWFVAVTITLYNKWTFSTFGFHFPVTFIIGTFSMNWVMSVLLRRHLHARLPKSALPVPPARRKVLVIGVCTAFEIAASNLSLLTLSVSFHTMIKSSTPLFVLLFSVGLGLERPNCMLLSSMALVTIGVMLCSYGEVLFDWLGFTYILSAAMAGGLRWSLSQLLLQSANTDAAPGPGGDSSSNRSGGARDIAETLHENLLRSVELLYHQLPVSVCALVPAWLLLERVRFLLWVDAQPESVGLLCVKLGLVIAGCALLAFVLIVTELSLLALTSSVTLAISGIAKELLLIAAAVALFGDNLRCGRLCTCLLLCLAAYLTADTCASSTAI
jgi:solute carrier family 35 protein C2